MTKDEIVSIHSWLASEVEGMKVGIEEKTLMSFLTWIVEKTKNYPNAFKHLKKLILSVH